MQQQGRLHITRQIAGHSKDLSKELDNIADRAFEVAKLARELEEQHARPLADASVQCSLGAADPVYQLDRSQRLKPFEFQPLERKHLDGKTWQKIRAINLDKMAGESDGRLLMEFYGELAYADLEADSGYNLTEANLIKLCQVCQLMLQWQQWQVEQGHHAVQMLTEELTSLQAGLSLIPSNIGLADIDHGLAGLGNDFARVANTDMDLMFQKARAEERAGRQSTLADHQLASSMGAPATSTAGAAPVHPGMPAAVASRESSSARGSGRMDAGADSLTGYVRRQQQQQQQQQLGLPTLHVPSPQEPQWQAPQPPIAPHHSQPQLMAAQGLQKPAAAQPQQGAQHALQPHYVSPSEQQQAHRAPLTPAASAAHPSSSQPTQLANMPPPLAQPPSYSTVQPALASSQHPFAQAQSFPRVAGPPQHASALGAAPDPFPHQMASMLGGPAPHPSAAQYAGGQQAAAALPLHNPNLPTGLPRGQGPLQMARGAASGSYNNIAPPK